MSTKALLSEQPQGIGSILGGSEFEKPNRTGSTAASLRRTLSADMSSKKWLLQHGFSPLKRIASSEELLPSSDDIWNSNQSKDEKNKINEQQQQSGGGQYDMWSSILTQKPSSLPPPYVHPLVKRSKTSLTGKSLEICTENLGSDSGSDGFSTYSPSEISSNSDDDDDADQEEEEEEEEEVKKESEIVDKQEMAGNVHEKVNSSCSASASAYVSRKSPPRSFPPPLPSLSRPGLHIRPRREDGRLVLQAITVPSQNYFHAQRQDGRLLLTLIKSPSQQQSMEENDENEEEEIEEEEIQVAASDDDEEEEGFESENEEEETMVEKGGFEFEMEFNQQLPTKKLPIGVINVHRSAVMMNKLIGGLAINRNPNWSHKLEKMVQMEVDDEEEEEANDSTTLFPQSLPSPPPRKAMPRLIPTSPTTVTSSFNTYEYCWRRKPSSVTGGGIMTKQSLPINNNNMIITSKNNNAINNNFLVSSRNSSKAYQEKQQQLVVKRGGDCLLAPLIKSCKEPRRSLLSWEPYCIATS